MKALINGIELIGTPEEMMMLISKKTINKKTQIVNEELEDDLLKKHLHKRKYRWGKWQKKIKIINDRNFRTKTRIHKLLGLSTCGDAWKRLVKLCEDEGISFKVKGKVYGSNEKKEVSHTSLKELAEYIRIDENKLRKILLSVSFTGKLLLGNTDLSIIQYRKLIELIVLYGNIIERELNLKGHFYIQNKVLYFKENNNKNGEKNE